jgi:hypothetical protein
LSKYKDKCLIQDDIREVNFLQPCKWELKLTGTSRGKRKEGSRWRNSSAVEEEDELKIMHCNILVCGVLICMASVGDLVILGPWRKCELSLYRRDIKASQILRLNTVTVPENLLLV